MPDKIANFMTDLYIEMREIICILMKAYSRKIKRFYLFIYEEWFSSNFDPAIFKQTSIIHIIHKTSYLLHIMTAYASCSAFYLE